jgi:DNA-binding MarR family transcriptional regulator
VLTNRLERLQEEGVVERQPYQERPTRYEYHLTEKGLDLWPTLMGLIAWGDKHEAADGPPIVVEHRGCGGHVNDRRTCERCGAELSLRDTKVRPGPGARQSIARR